MTWLYLILGILLEVAGTVCLKLSDGCTRLLPTALMFVLYGVSLVPLALALKTMQVGVVYAVWSAVGTLLVATIGILWFKEPASTLKLVSLALIIVGLICLNIGPELG